MVQLVTAWPIVLFEALVSVPSFIAFSLVELPGRYARRRVGASPSI